MPSADPLITVVVPTYNSAGTLRCALASLLAQACADFEALVMGDGCTDDSEAAVASFDDPRLRWRNLPVNSGSQSEPNNQALRLARGRWIAYLGHDDLWFPWHLSELVRAAASDGADFAASTCVMLRPDGHHVVTGPVGTGRTYADQYTPPSSWLHRKEVIARVGLWGRPPQLRYGIDFDYQRRIALAGFRCKHAGRLSVLKFPSAWWANYDPSRPHPQPDYLRRVIAAPAEVERELLDELVTRYASDDHGAAPGRPLRAALIALSRRVIDSYGRDRWPLSDFLYWRQQRFMRRNRRRRGLPAN